MNIDNMLISNLHKCINFKNALYIK